MGQVGSRRADITRSLRENESSLTELQLDGERLTEKAVRRITEALRLNRWAS